MLEAHDFYAGGLLCIGEVCSFKLCSTEHPDFHYTNELVQQENNDGCIMPYIIDPLCIKSLQTSNFNPLI